jgi:hypothetical protein
MPAPTSPPAGVEEDPWIVTRRAWVAEKVFPLPSAFLPIVLLIDAEVAVIVDDFDFDFVADSVAVLVFVFADVVVDAESCRPSIPGEVPALR